MRASGLWTTFCVVLVVDHLDDLGGDDNRAAWGTGRTWGPWGPWGSGRTWRARRTWGPGRTGGDGGRRRGRWSSVRRWWSGRRWWSARPWSWDRRWWSVRRWWSARRWSWDRRWWSDRRWSWARRWWWVRRWSWGRRWWSARRWSWADGGGRGGGGGGGDEDVGAGDRALRLGQDDVDHAQKAAEARQHGDVGPPHDDAGADTGDVLADLLVQGDREDARDLRLVFAAGLVISGLPLRTPPTISVKPVEPSPSERQPLSMASRVMELRPTMTSATLALLWAKPRWPVGSPAAMPSPSVNPLRAPIDSRPGMLIGSADWAVGPKLLVGSVAVPVTSGVGAMTRAEQARLHRRRVGGARGGVDVGRRRRRQRGQEDRGQGNCRKGHRPDPGSRRLHLVTPSVILAMIASPPAPPAVAQRP